MVLSYFGNRVLGLRSRFVRGAMKVNISLSGRRGVAASMIASTTPSTFDMTSLFQKRMTRQLLASKSAVRAASYALSTC